METSTISRHLTSPTKGPAEAANNVLWFAKENRICLKYKQGLRSLVHYTDAGAIGLCRDNRSQGGRISLSLMMRGTKIAAWTHWKRKVFHRTCRSSAATECLLVVETFDAMMWLANMWKELTRDSLDGRKCLLTKNEGLVRKAVNTALHLKNRFRTDMAILRQGLRLGQSKVKWVPNGAILADSLSKDDICVSNNVRERVKRSLSRALPSNCHFIRQVSTRTVAWEDTSRY